MKYLLICVGLFACLTMGIHPIMAQWTENFDSYSEGSLPPQSDWTGWQDDPGAANFDVTTDQALSAPHSLAIDGPDDAVHEYSGYISDYWQYTAWQYIPVDAAGEDAFFILLNTYDPAGVDHNWSLQLAFDPDAEIVYDSDSASGSLPLVKGSWIEIKVQIDLVNDMQTYFYNGDQLGNPKSWTAGSTGGGARNIGAVDLWGNNTTYAVYYDDMSIQTYIPEPTPTPTVTPTSEPTEVPTVTPTPEPACDVLGVELWMPSTYFIEDDECGCIVYACNPDGVTYTDVPLFVILDVYGSYFFAPAFSAFDNYLVDLEPGLTEVIVLPTFNWPPNAGSADNIVWYAAMTDVMISRLYGTMDTWTFGWGN